MARVRTKRTTRTKKRSRGYKVKASITRSRFRRKRTVIPRGVNARAFPRTKLVRHKYVDIVTIPAASSSGFSQLYTFRANSTYDPDYTGTGHQPLYRDEMAAQYASYTVIYSAIKVTPSPNSSQCMWTLICDNNPSVGLSDPNTICEDHGSTVPRTQNQGVIPHVLRGFYDAKKWWKTDMAGLLAAGEHQTAAGSNPNADQTLYFHIIVHPGTTGLTLGARTVHVELVQVCLWRQPASAVGSLKCI